MRRWTLVSTFTLALAAVAPAQPPGVNTPGSPPNSAVAATVNGEPIRLDTVDAVIKARLPSTPLTPAQLKQFRTEVASDLVDDVLLRQFLRQHGPKIDPAEVDSHLKALAASLAKRGKTLNDFYRETNQTEAELRETWTTLLQLTGYVKQHVTDEQLKQYYAANKDHFDRVEVRVCRIVIRVGPAATTAERAAAREKLQAVRAEIAAGRVTFADAAKKHSQCPSALQGGDLGYVLRKGMVPDELFCQTAFALKVGEVSGVIESESGTQLLTVTDRKPGKPTTFESCIEEVRDQLADDFRGELVAKLRKQAQVQITVP